MIAQTKNVLTYEEDCDGDVWLKGYGGMPILYTCPTEEEKAALAHAAHATQVLPELIAEVQRYIHSECCTCHDTPARVEPCQWCRFEELFLKACKL